jgi:hypothetical protein
LKDSRESLSQVIEQALEELWKDADIVGLEINECPGSAEVVSARQRAWYAMLAVAFTASAAIWQTQRVISEFAESDADEIKARVSAGPAFEIVQSVEYARLSLNASVVEMRKIIRAALTGS